MPTDHDAQWRQTAVHLRRALAQLGEDMEIRHADGDQGSPEVVVSYLAAIKAKADVDLWHCHHDDPEHADLAELAATEYAHWHAEFSAKGCPATE